MTPAQRLKHWRENPCQFISDNFKVDMDHWQVEASGHIGGIEFKPRRRVALKACTGPGKSAELAWAGWYRLACFGSKSSLPKGAAISGEGRDNLRDNLWAELYKWQQRSPFLMDQFQWNKEQIRHKDRQDWFLSARSYPKSANAEEIGRAMSGLHSEWPFILLDETGSMPLQVGQKATQIFTGGVRDALIIQAGNPTSTDGLLYQSCTHEADIWNVITITADPDDPHRTPRVDIEHAREMIEKYGKDNAWVMATILGLFPPGGINTLISLEDVEQAQRRKPADDGWKWAQKRLGVDVARFGDDRTIIFPRQGLMTFKYAEMRNARTNDIAARVIAAKSKWNSEVEFVDGTGGYGAGVVDSMIQGRHAPVEVMFSGKADSPRYYNKRTEMWFRMAEWMKRGCLIKDPMLVKELVGPTYTYKSGKMLLEPKDQIKDRLGYSPDIADGLALTFAHDETPARTDLGYYREKYGEKNRVKTEFDPFDR